MNNENTLNPTPAADTWRGKLHQLGYTYDHQRMEPLIGLYESWTNTRDNTSCTVCIDRYDDMPTSFTFTDRATNNSAAVNLNELMRLEHVTGTKELTPPQVTYVPRRR